MKIPAYLKMRVFPPNMADTCFTQSQVHDRQRNNNSEIRIENPGYL